MQFYDVINSYLPYIHLCLMADILASCGQSFSALIYSLGVFLLAVVVLARHAVVPRHTSVMYAMPAQTVSGKCLKSSVSFLNGKICASFCRG